jgi:hypothetical protein
VASGERHRPGAPCGRDRGDGEASGRLSARDLDLGAERRRPATPVPADEVRGDDRAGRGADEVLALPQLEPASVLESGQKAHHPGLAEHAAATEHELRPGV